jgi:glycerol uptake facilitator-like aquaporin
MSETSMIKLFLGELIGTFFFIAIVIVTIDTKKKGYFSGLDWLKIAFGLAAAIILVGTITGANLNPAISCALYLNDELSLEKLGLYVVAQLLGATLSVVFFKFYQSELQDIPS